MTKLKEGQEVVDNDVNVFIVKCFDNEKVILQLISSKRKKDQYRPLIEYNWNEMEEIFNVKKGG